MMNDEVVLDNGICNTIIDFAAVLYSNTKEVTIEQANAALNAMKTVVEKLKTAALDTKSDAEGESLLRRIWNYTKLQAHKLWAAMKTFWAWISGCFSKKAVVATPVEAEPAAVAA